MIDINEYRARRSKLLLELDGAVAVIFAGDANASLHGKFKADSHFSYLTGISDEPGAALLLDPNAEDPKRRAILFLKPLAPETEVWDGLRDPISTQLKSAHGFETILRTNLLARTLTHAARLRKRLACLHSFAVFDAPVSTDLATFRKVSERVPGCSIEDRSNLVPSMRAIKSTRELDLMRHAAKITAAAYADAKSLFVDGSNERDIQRALESSWFKAGASGNAYNPIIGAGINSTVLHYNTNDQTLRGGDVLLIDAAAAYGGYCADVTRTYSVGGKFSARQREIYSLVLEAQLASIEAAKPGARMHDVDEASRAVFRKAGLEDSFIHGIGHQLGLEVHDATPDGPLMPGMVITIEPGIYLPAERIGVRIEDDILITDRGNENLTSMIPKSVADIS